MEFTKKECILYLDKSRMTFSGSNISTVLVANIPPDILNDLELIDSSKLESFIQSFIAQYKINPNQLIIVLSPQITFDQDFPDKQGEHLDKDIQQFLESVPFENVVSKTFRLEKKLKVIATNRDICDLFKNSFERQGFKVWAIVPVSILQEIFFELAKSLDLHIILEKFYALKSYSFLVDTDEASYNVYNKEANLKKNFRLYILLGFFFTLLFILAIIVYLNFFSNSTSSPIKPYDASSVPRSIRNSPSIATPTLNNQLTTTPVSTESAK